jgi:hypothetical protein
MVYMFYIRSLKRRQFALDSRRQKKHKNPSLFNNNWLYCMAYCLLSTSRWWKRRRREGLCKSLRCSNPTLLLKRTIYWDFALRRFAWKKGVKEVLLLHWLPSTREPPSSSLDSRCEASHTLCESRSRVRLRCRGAAHHCCEKERWFFIKKLRWRVGFEYPIARYWIVYCLSTLVQDCTCVSHCQNGSFEKDPVTQAFRVTYAIRERSGRSCDVFQVTSRSWSKTE